MYRFNKIGMYLVAQLGLGLGGLIKILSLGHM